MWCLIELASRVNVRGKMHYINRYHARPGMHAWAIMCNFRLRTSRRLLLYYITCILCTTSLCICAYNIYSYPIIVQLLLLCVYTTMHACIHTIYTYMHLQHMCVHNTHVVCTCVHVCIHVHTHVCDACMCVCTCMYTSYTCMYTHTCMCTCTHTCPGMYTHMYMCVYMYIMYTCVHIHITHVHTHMCIRTHAYTHHVYTCVRTHYIIHIQTYTRVHM